MYSSLSYRKKLFGISLLLTFLLLLLLVIPFDKQNHWIVTTIGRLHPLIVHLPIGILNALFILEIINLVKPKLQLATACKFLIWLIVISIIPTVLVGLTLASEGSNSFSVSVHQWLGWSTAFVSIWLLVANHEEIIVKQKRFSFKYHGMLTICIVLISLTGHFGGALTHGSGYLTEHLPEELKTLFEDDRSGQLAKLISQHGVLDMDELQPMYSQTIKPILSNSCYECHGDEKQKGGLQLNTLNADIVAGEDGKKWRAVLDMINLGEMPPEDEEQLTDQERRDLVEWLSSSLKYAIELRKGENRTVMRRLTRSQYTNSLNSVLHVPVNFGDVLPADAKSEMGFSNNGEVQQTSPLHVEYYQRLAREALDEAIGPEEKPPSTHYKITFGKGIGKGKTSGYIGGFQSAPIDTLDFVVDIIDSQGNIKTAHDEESQKALNTIKKNIGIGMRGSDPDRYNVTEEGMVLYSALPHKEVTPKSWQGPSPNLKLLMRKCFPEKGDFELRVVASSGSQLDYGTQERFISLRVKDPIDVTGESIILEAAKSRNTKNLSLKKGALIANDVARESSATFEFEVPKEGYYQIDFSHPYANEDDMPSVRLSMGKNKHTERLHLAETDSDLLKTSITLAYLKKGLHKLEIGGWFFVGFNNVLINYLPSEHPITQKLEFEAEANRQKYKAVKPLIQAFAGTRTDDGMDYQVFDKSVAVTTEQGEFKEYVLKGRLENLPIPVLDMTDQEILSNIMIVGLYNNSLVKDPGSSGPPLLVKSIEFEGPFYPEWPPKSYSSIFFPSEKKESDKEAYTREVLNGFIEKAFRRPAAQTEVDKYLTFWNSIKDDFPRYEDGVKEVLIAILCSPNFIYLANPYEERKALIDYSLASRLSYFLWNGPPDEELIKLASKGKLKKNLDDQVTRMVADPKIWHMIRTFSNEWLRIDRQENMNTDIGEFKDFSRFVKSDMKNETYHFFHKVISENMSILNFIESDFAMLNQNLAEFYGIEGVYGNHFRPVMLSDSLKRGGLLSQGAFLNGHSDGSQAHPIKRAVWLRSKILGDRPPDPPPNVPELDPETPGFDKMTLKEQLELHRDKPSCNDCHKKIDPYGIVFENYDAVGRYQLLAKGRPIDSKVVLPDMTEVEGIDGIKAYILAKRKDDFTKSLVTHLFAYALGRDVTFADEEEIDDIVDEVRSDDYLFQSVIEGIVTSPSFLEIKTKSDESKIVAVK